MATHKWKIVSCPPVFKKKASREVGIFFCFSFFIDYMMYWEDWVKKNFFQKSWEKSSNRPFLAHSGGGQETTSYLRVA